MVYTYICEDNHTTELVQSIKEETPKAVICETCQKNAKRDWGNGRSLIIPENFKATSEIYNSDDLTNPSVIGRRLNQTRPSGKHKVYY